MSGWTHTSHRYFLLCCSRRGVFFNTLRILLIPIGSNARNILLGEKPLWGGKQLNNASSTNFFSPFFCDLCLNFEGVWLVWQDWIITVKLRLTARTCHITVMQKFGFDNQVNSRSGQRPPRKAARVESFEQWIFSSSCYACWHCSHGALGQGIKDVHERLRCADWRLQHVVDFAVHTSSWPFQLDAAFSLLDRSASFCSSGSMAELTISDRRNR